MASDAGDMNSIRRARTSGMSRPSRTRRRSPAYARMSAQTARRFSMDSVRSVADETPLCLLLLDGVLEEVPFARRAQDLLRSPAVVALEPGRGSPHVLADRIARRVARRLPGNPRVVVLIGPRQYRLGRAPPPRHAGAELWYAPAGNGADGAAGEHATFVFDAADDPGIAAFQANAELWDRLEALGVARR